MRRGTDRRIVISGTYSTGKTTTATVLSIATGIPMVNASSAREILTSLYPGRKFHHMSAEELLALGLRRLDERIRAETLLAQQGGFVSDGSVLNEWAYAAVRARIGLNPGAPIPQQVVKALFALPALPFLQRYVSAYRTMARLHAAESYDEVVHLPVEFDMDTDGHRPVSERYRRLSDRGLRQEFRDLGLPVHESRGAIEDRVEGIITALDLPRVVPIPAAMRAGREQIKNSREAVARKILEQQVVPTLGARAALIFRF